MSILLIAATKVDAYFGKIYFEKLNLKIQSCYLSESPAKQAQLQIDPPKLTACFYQKIEENILTDTSCIIIYCNSLSGALNLKSLRNHYKIPIVTPMDVYKDIAHRFNSIGVFAANCQGLAHIEKIFISQNPVCNVKGFCSLELVNAIESGESADQIITRFAIIDQCKIFEAHGCKLIIIGCTHFFYLLDTLTNKLNAIEFTTSIIEPSSLMLKKVYNYLLNKSKYEEKSI